jgi:competence protein ComEA
MCQMEQIPLVQSARPASRTVSRLGLLVLPVALAATSLPSTAEGLPDGPGKDLVEAICSSCHDTERVAAQQLTKPQWEAKVLEMLQEEPDVKQSERDKIVEYLATNFPARANVNKADAKELQALLEISPESAAAIVSYRQKNGSFKTLDDLKKVPGVDAAKLDAKREIIDFKE